MKLEYNRSRKMNFILYKTGVLLLMQNYVMSKSLNEENMCELLIEV